VCWEEVRSELEVGTERIVGVDVAVVRGTNSGWSATCKDRERQRETSYQMGLFASSKYESGKYAC
jgi:hypothetical protein